MFDYKVKYKINDMVILKILRDYCLTQSDLNIFEYTDTKLHANFKPWNETIQILNGILILTECGNSIPDNIVDSIKQHCTRILMLSPYIYLFGKKPIYEHHRKLDYELHLEISSTDVVAIKVWDKLDPRGFVYCIYQIHNYNIPKLRTYELYVRGFSLKTFDNTVLSTRQKSKPLVEAIDVMSKLKPISTFKRV